MGKIDTLNKKIVKQQAKVEVIRGKYDEISKKFTQEEKTLNTLLKAKAREEQKMRFNMLEKVCNENKVDINKVTDAIKNGQLNVLLETAEQLEKHDGLSTVQNTEK